MKIRKVFLLLTLIIALLGFAMTGCESEEEAAESAGQEEASETGMARIKDAFSMENMPAGSAVPVSWWELF